MKIIDKVERLCNSSEQKLFKDVFSGSLKMFEIFPGDFHLIFSAVCHEAPLLQQLSTAKPFLDSQECSILSIDIHIDAVDE